MPHKRTLPGKPTTAGDRRASHTKALATSGDARPAAEPPLEEEVPAHTPPAGHASTDADIASDMSPPGVRSPWRQSQRSDSAAEALAPGSDGHGQPEAKPAPPAVPVVAPAQAQDNAAVAAHAQAAPASAPETQSASPRSADVLAETTPPAEPPSTDTALADDLPSETLDDGSDLEDLAETPLDRPAPDAAAFPPGWEDELPIIRIRPTGGWRSLDLREVWRYRELMLTLAWREISIRYKQTVLGAAWAILQPLMTTGIFSVLFALLMGRGNEPTPQGIPYVVSTFCAMLPWQLFAHSLNQSGNILVQYRAMITKIYFPRLILPAAAVLSTLMDFAVAFVALGGMMLFYGVVPGWAVVLLPLFVVLALVSSLAVGLWLAAMNAIYRDFRYVIPFIVQIGMFISPVVYSTDSIRHRLPEWAMTLYLLNPMAGVIEGFRWALLGTARAPGMELALSAAAATVILVAGMFYFRRMERTIADLI